MFRETCRVLENKKIAPGHFVIKFASKKIGKKAQPGEFVQILCSDSYEPLLPRPFSFLTATPSNFSILYHTVGRGTTLLSQAKKGDVFHILGPLGRGFTVVSSQISAIRKKQKIPLIPDYRLLTTFILVGGGVGIPPLFHWAEYTLKRRLVSKQSIHVFLGARDKSLLLCEDSFKKLGVQLHLATDNGSKGHKGVVTDLLKQFFLSSVSCPLSSVVYTCGPTPMLKAVSALAKKYEIACEVSVEVPMACGFGACLGCAVKVRPQKTENRKQKTESKNLSFAICPPSSEQYRFAVACCEGPVFPAGDIVWD